MEIPEIPFELKLSEAERKRLSILDDEDREI